MAEIKNYPLGDPNGASFIGSDATGVVKRFLLNSTMLTDMINSASGQELEDLASALAWVLGYASSIVVNSSIGLTNAMSSPDTTTILVAPSATKYTLSLTGSVYRKRIVSQDPTNPAVFSTINLTDCSNIQMESLQFNQIGDARSDTIADIRLTRCSNIVIRKTNHIGRATQRYTGSETLGCQGIRFTDSINNVIVDSITMTGQKFAFIADAGCRTTNLKLWNNYVTQWQFDSFIMGNVVHGVTLQGNTFIRPLGTLWSLNHMDFCQFFTTGATEGSSDILIDGNVFDCNGGNFAQGPFMADEGGVGYTNVTFTNNFVNVSNWFGFRIDNCTNLLCANNVFLNDPTATGIDDQPGSSGAGMQPNIYTVNSSFNAVIRDCLIGVGVTPQLAGLVTTSNIVNASEDRHNALYWYRLFPNIHSNTTRVIRDYQVPTTFLTAPTYMQAAGFAFPAIPTNLLTNGANFSLAPWANTEVTVSNAGLATQQLKETAVSSLHRSGQSVTRVAATVNYSISIRLRNNLNRNKFRMSVYNQAFNLLQISADLGALTATVDSVGTSFSPPAGSMITTLTRLPSAWYDFQTLFTESAAGGTFVRAFPTLLDDSGADTYVGDTAKGMATSYVSLIVAS